ncbi:MAG: multicopper oxidase family protein [Tepidisphaeraceae bacterium]
MKQTRELFTRREMIASSAAALASAKLLASDQSSNHRDDETSTTPAAYTPVITPNGVTLPFRIVDGVKVFHLTAQEVDHEFAPGLRAKCWGYNGRTTGPTIECVEGDRVRIYVTNRLPAPTTVHWHGVLVPSGMDGVSGLSQAPIRPGETFVYEFTLRQHGTCMYHSHFDEMIQQAMGLMGMFIIHPRQPVGPRADRDFALLSSEWKIEPGTYRPDPMEMVDFNVLTFNSKAYPGTEPLVVKQGQRVRLRLGNLSAMSHHSIHLHGYYWNITGTDGGDIVGQGQWPMTTVIVPTGSTKTVEFVAVNSGDWAMHCHMTHHAMNQMGHGLPNMIGVKPGDLNAVVGSLVPGYMTMGTNGMGGHGAHAQHMGVPPNSIPMLGAPGKHGSIDMGGMFTILKVREQLTNYDDPGWYDNPPGTLAVAATSEQLRRDGVNTDTPAP